MEERGIIKKYSIQIDHEKLGYDLTVLISVRVNDPPQFFEHKHPIMHLPEPCAIYNITGDHDLVIIAKFKNRKQLSNFTKKLLSLPNIIGTRTQLVLETRREDFNIL